MEIREVLANWWFVCVSMWMKAFSIPQLPCDTNSACETERGLLWHHMTLPIVHLLHMSVKVELNFTTNLFIKMTKANPCSHMTLGIKCTTNDNMNNYQVSISALQNAAYNSIKCKRTLHKRSHHMEMSALHNPLVHQIQLDSALWSWADLQVLFWHG